MEKPKECFRTRVGGQALIEGIMMRGPEKICVAVRKPDGTIDLMMDQVKHHPWSKIPFLRGVLNMVENLVLGYRYLMHSADVSMEDEEEEEPSKLEQWLQDHLGDAFEKALMGAASVLGVVLALVLFMALPAFCVKTLGRFVPLAGPVKALLEGVVKIAIFVIYLYLCTRMKELHRVFEYHGAEHKTIACYEAELELTVENVRKQIRFHPRCGTSFIFLVVLLSIIIGMFLPWKNLWARFGLQLLMLIPETSIGYELIKLAGRYDNIFTRIISAPGIWLQHITTCEPDDPQIEVAIAALKPCIPENKEDDKW